MWNRITKASLSIDPYGIFSCTPLFCAYKSNIKQVRFLSMSSDDEIPSNSKGKVMAEI